MKKINSLFSSIINKCKKDIYHSIKSNFSVYFTIFICPFFVWIVK